MKKLLILFLGIAGWLTLAGTAHATIAFLGENTSTFPNTASGIASTTLTTSTNAGELVVVFASVTNNNQALTISDSASDTYTSVYSVTESSGINDMWYLPNAPSGITKVSVKEGSGSGNGGLWVMHYSGIATTSPIDASATLAGPSSTPWATKAITTLNASDLLMGEDICRYNGANCATVLTGSWLSLGVLENPASNWDGSNGGSGIADYQIVSTTGSYQNTGTNVASSSNYSSIVAFKGAASSGSTTAAAPYFKLLSFGW